MQVFWDHAMITREIQGELMRQLKARVDHAVLQAENELLIYVVVFCVGALVSVAVVVTNYR